MATFSNSLVRFKVQFNVGITTPTLDFTDMLSAVYQSEYGIDPLSVQGIVKITSPLGVLYSNAGWATDSFAAPNIDGFASPSPIWSVDDLVALPLDNDGVPVKGLYTIEYKVTDGVTVYYASKTFDYQYVSPTPVIDLEANCRLSTLTSTDNTEYNVAFAGVNVTPTIGSGSTHNVYPPRTSTLKVV